MSGRSREGSGVLLLRLSRHLSLGIALLLPSPAAEADIGPKPTMKLVMSYRIEPAVLQKAELLKCGDGLPTTCQPVKMFPTLTCNAATCLSWGYGYPEYQKLRLTFADRERESNEFRKQAYNALYTVTVYEDHLAVREVTYQPFHFISFSRALLVTLVVELAVAAIYLARLKLLRCLSWVIVANVLSLPLVWFAFPALNMPGFQEVVIAELFAVIFEAAVLYLANRNKGLAPRHAATLSLVMNASSFAVGLLLPIAGLHGAA